MPQLRCRKCKCEIFNKTEGSYCNNCVLSAPFPYYGGKRRWADTVLKAFGDERRAVYIEPFFGSGAVLLANPEPYAREIVCDIHGHIANFWRAIRDDPEQVAYYADWPTIHQDLTARHKWLVNWARDNSAKLSDDPDYYDAKAAGWWVWGIAIWIGGGWCADKNTKMNDANVDVDCNLEYENDVLQQTIMISDKVPHVDCKGGGQGVAVQKKNLPFMDSRPHIGGQGVNAQRSSVNKNRIPHVSHGGGGQVVSAQRLDIYQGKFPHVSSKFGGRGVDLQRTHIPLVRGFTGRGVTKKTIHIKSTEANTFSPANGDRLIEWFYAIADRLKNVVVLNRDFSSALSPTMLQQVETSRKPPVRILLDPPYRVSSGRKGALYESDVRGESEDVAERAYRWAIDNANRPGFAIAYCCQESDFPVPDGWSSQTFTYTGVIKKERRHLRDMIMFSPGCFLQQPESTQLGLFV